MIKTVLNKTVGSCLSSLKKRGITTVRTLSARLSLILSGIACLGKKRHKQQPEILKKSLFEAISKHNLSHLKKCLQAGLSPHVKNRQGESALHAAVKSAFYDGAVELLKYGADYTQKDPHGNSLLVTAIFSESPDMCELLINAGVNPCQKNKQGLAPIHFLGDACRTHYAFRKILKLLLNYVWINTQSTQGETALSFANGEFQIRLLIENGASPTFIQKEKRHHLFRKNVLKNTALTREIIQSGCSVDTCNRQNETLLSQSLSYGFFKTSVLLLKLGADPNIPNKFGITPLEKIIKHNQPSLLYCALKNNADLSTKLSTGFSARDEIMYNEHLSFVLNYHLLPQTKQQQEQERVKLSSSLFGYNSPLKSALENTVSQRS